MSQFESIEIEVDEELIIDSVTMYLQETLSPESFSLLNKSKFHSSVINALFNEHCIIAIKGML